jgi:hypothetical protein
MTELELKTEPVAWRVVTNNTALSFYSTREDANHGAKNRLAYVKGCTSAVIEPLYIHLSPQPADMEKAVEAARTSIRHSVDSPYIDSVVFKRTIVPALTAAAPFLRGVAMPDDSKLAIAMNAVYDDDLDWLQIARLVLARLASEAEGQERG